MLTTENSSSINNSGFCILLTFPNLFYNSKSMDELGRSLPLSEGMVDAELGGEPDLDRKDRVCLNCGTSLTDKFCPHCGQKDIPKRQTLGELVMNFIGSFTSFESKFFQTVWTLMSKPGFLVTEYNNGRRERYYILSPGTCVCVH